MVKRTESLSGDGGRADTWRTPTPLKFSYPQPQLEKLGTCCVTQTRWMVGLVSDFWQRIKKGQGSQIPDSLGEILSWILPLRLSDPNGLRK